MSESTSSSTSSTSRSVLVFLAFALVCIIISNPGRIFSAGRSFFDYISFSDCRTWSLDQYNQTSTRYLCPNDDLIKATIWTFESSGVKKYLQWLVVRRLISVRFFHLDDRCRIVKDTNFHSSRPTSPLILVYFLTFQIDRNECSAKIQRLVQNANEVKHIYFTRRSIKALQAFDQLDRSVNISGNFKEIAHFPHLTDFVVSKKWIRFYAEDLIEENLNDCEKKLIDFVDKLGLNTTNSQFKQILEFDSHHFIADSVWWDQSFVVETLLNRSIPPRPTTLNYSTDFFYLHGRRSFAEYLAANRQCFDQGVFFQMKNPSIVHRNSTDAVDRCPSKPFDCAFSDLYSFEDREDFYRSTSFRSSPVRCGLMVPSMFDQIREKYARNQTCQTIIFTVITSCYDPLPEIQGQIHSSFCFVAMVDNRTMNALINRKATGRWDIINLGANATAFSVEPKTTETLKLIGVRLFPMAKWILWLDGKAKIIDLDVALTRIPTPFIGAHHPEWTRNLENEVPATILHMKIRAGGLTLRFNNTLRDITLQEGQYQREGIYNRSNIFGLRLYDIAVLMYRNHHPCMERYMCSWHNEINFYSFRGQLSVYYPAIRLNLVDYTEFFENKFFSIIHHRPIC